MRLGQRASESDPLRLTCSGRLRVTILHLVRISYERFRGFATLKASIGARANKVAKGVAFGPAQVSWCKAIRIVISNPCYIKPESALSCERAIVLRNGARTARTVGKRASTPRSGTARGGVPIALCPCPLFANAGGRSARKRTLTRPPCGANRRHSEGNKARNAPAKSDPPMSISSGE